MNTSREVGEYHKHDKQELSIDGQNSLQSSQYQYWALFSKRQHEQKNHMQQTKRSHQLFMESTQNLNDNRSHMLDITPISNHSFEVQNENDDNNGNKKNQNFSFQQVPASDKIDTHKYMFHSELEHTHESALNSESLDTKEKMIQIKRTNNSPYLSKSKQMVQNSGQYSERSCIQQHENCGLNKKFFQIALLTHFFINLKTQLPALNYQILDKFHYKVIGDVTADENQGNKLSFQYQIHRIKLCKKVERIMSFIPIFEPLTLKKLYWDVWIIFLIGVYLVVIPLVIGFNMKLEYFLGGSAIHNLFITFLCLDIFVNLNTGYFEKGKIVKKREKIIKHYIQDGFFSDMFGMITVMFYKLYSSLTEQYEELNFTQLIFYLKFYNFSRIYKRLEMRFRLKPQISNLFNLLNLLVIVLFICHVFACGWVYVARKNQEAEETWLRKREIEEKEWHLQFLHSFYFMTVTMVTVGYGDITPTNTLEVFVCVITMLIACCVFAYSMNEIGLVLEKLQQEREQQNKDLYIINKYMSKKNIEKDLQFQIVQYLQYFWQEQSSQDGEREDLIISQLSANLRQKLLLDSNKLVLQECPIFKNNFSQELILKTIPLIQELLFMPEEFVLKQGEEDDYSIYFIEKGSVDLFFTSQNSKQESNQQLQKQQQQQQEEENAHQQFFENSENNCCDNKSNGKKIISLNKGQYFGQLSFFSGQIRKLSARTKEFTTILKISRADFVELLKEHKDDNETFSHIKDQILFSKNLSVLQMDCFSCKQTDHTIEICQLIQPFRNRQRVLRKHVFSNEQQRNMANEKIYRMREKQNSLSQLANNLCLAEQFQVLNSMFIADLYSDDEDYENDDEQFYSDLISEGEEGAEIIETEKEEVKSLSSSGNNYNKPIYQLQFDDPSIVIQSGRSSPKSPQIKSPQRQRNSKANQQSEKPQQQYLKQFSFKTFSDHSPDEAIDVIKEDPKELLCSKKQSDIQNNQFQNTNDNMMENEKAISQKRISFQRQKTNRKESLSYIPNEKSKRLSLKNLQLQQHVLQQNIKSCLKKMENSVALTLNNQMNNSRNKNTSNNRFAHQKHAIKNSQSSLQKSAANQLYYNNNNQHFMISSPSQQRIGPQSKQLSQYRIEESIIQPRQNKIMGMSKSRQRRIGQTSTTLNSSNSSKSLNNQLSQLSQLVQQQMKIQNIQLQYQQQQQQQDQDYYLNIKSNANNYQQEPLYNSLHQHLQQQQFLQQLNSNIQMHHEMREAELVQNPFEIMHMYEKYYPEHNYSRVLEKMKQIQMKHLMDRERRSAQVNFQINGSFIKSQRSQQKRSNPYQNSPKNNKSSKIVMSVHNNANANANKQSNFSVYQQQKKNT